MSLSLYDLIVWTVPLTVSFYTLTYALWLWRQKQKKAAVGAAVLAVLTAVYPGVVLFLVHT